MLLYCYRFISLFSLDIPNYIHSLFLVCQFNFPTNECKLFPHFPNEITHTHEFPNLMYVFISSAHYCVVEPLHILHLIVSNIPILIVLV